MRSIASSGRRLGSHSSGFVLSATRITVITTDSIAAVYMACGSGSAAGRFSTSVQGGGMLPGSLWCA